MGIEKLRIEHTEGDKERLEEIESAEGHHDYSAIFDKVVRDPDTEMEIIQKALKAEADRDEAALLTLEAIAKAKKSSSE